MRNFNLCSPKKHQHIRKPFVLFYFLEHPSSIFHIYRFLNSTKYKVWYHFLFLNSNPPRKQINKQKTWNVSGFEMRLLTFRLIFDLFHKPRIPVWVNQLSSKKPWGTWRLGERERWKVYWNKRKSEIILISVQEGGFTAEKFSVGSKKNWWGWTCRSTVKWCSGSCKQQALSQNCVKMYFPEYVGISSRDRIWHFSSKQERLSRLGAPKTLGCKNK